MRIDSVALLTTIAITGGLLGAMLADAASRSDAGGPAAALFLALIIIGMTARRKN